MRLRQALGGLANAEIAVFCVSTQTVGFEVLVAIMADGDALFRPRAFCSRYAARLGLAVLGFDGFSRAGFAGRLVGNSLARRRFFLGGGAGRGPRCRLLLGHRRSPFSLTENGYHNSPFVGWAKPPHGIGPDQCSRKTPSTERSSAGLISLECAT